MWTQRVRVPTERPLCTPPLVVMNNKNNLYTIFLQPVVGFATGHTHKKSYCCSSLFFPWPHFLVARSPPPSSFLPPSSSLPPRSRNCHPRLISSCSSEHRFPGTRPSRWCSLMTGEGEGGRGTGLCETRCNIWEVKRLRSVQVHDMFCLQVISALENNMSDVGTQGMSSLDIHFCM